MLFRSAFITIMLVVSMLITIAVQMLAAALNLRGINLGKGLVNTFNTILPGFEDQAKGFADRILGGRLLSDSSASIFGRRATAVRPQEVFDSMMRIATGRREAPAEMRNNARRLLLGLGMREAVLNAAEAQVATATGIGQQLHGTVQQLSEAATTAIAQLPANQQTQARAAIAALSDRLNPYEIAATRDAAAFTGAVEAAYRKFHYWFDVGQDRAQQWFSGHTRWFTIIFAIIFALWLELDTVAIFRLVSSNRAVRDSLVAQSGIVAKQAEKLLGDSQSVLAQSLDTWRSGLKEDNAKKAVATEVVKPSDSRGSLRERVQEKLTAAGIAGADVLLAALDSTIDKTVQESLKSSGQQYSEVKVDLEKTGFALFPADRKGRWGEKWGDNWAGHIWGMIFSAALLSLGAPFWYNALKNLASLRSKVAQNISTEQAGDKAPPGATLPRTVAPAPQPVKPG